MLVDAPVAALPLLLGWMLPADFTAHTLSGLVEWIKQENPPHSVCVPASHACPSYSSWTQLCQK